MTKLNLLVILILLLLPVSSEATQFVVLARPNTKASPKYKQQQYQRSKKNEVYYNYEQWEYCEVKLNTICNNWLTGNLPCKGDLNQDGYVNLKDYAIWAKGNNGQSKDS